MNTIWFPDLSTGAGPKYQILSDAIRGAVTSRQLSSGEKLLPVRKLAWKLHVTPGTVARAYQCLTEAGILRAEVGRGTFVANLNLSQPKPIAKPKESTDWPEVVDLRSPKLPESGQGKLLENAMIAMAAQAKDDLFVRYPSEQSDLPLRKAAHAWLSDSQIGPFDECDTVVTHGGQNAINLIFQTVLQGDAPVVFVESLSYAGFRHAARLSRAKIVSIESDEHGLRPDALHDAIHTYGGQILCTSPEVQNPTLHRTGLERRRQIANVIRHHKLHVIDDDCYRMGRDKLPSYRALLPESAWYITSISKELTPALRVGFAIAPKGWGKLLRRTRQHSSFGLSVPVNMMTVHILNDPMSKQVAAEVCARTNANVQSAVNVLGGYDLSWRNDVPLLWLRLPRGWRASSFCRAAEKKGVLVRSADDFALIDGFAPHAIRIAINGQVAPECFTQALLHLRDLLDDPVDQIEV